MASIRSICVFCGSKHGINLIWRRTAERLGTLMAERGIRLVYGGGRIGLMGVIADAVLASGGEVVGVIPDFLVKLEVGHANVTELVVVDSMHARKRRMFELSDAFVVLPGGIGTLDETFEIVSWKQLRQHTRPIVLVNAGGYWDPFKDLIVAIVKGGFGHPAIAELFTMVDDADSVLSALAAAPAVKEEVLTSHL
jgi:uncharacterized protein (TIGR00730 family)